MAVMVVGELLGCGSGEVSWSDPLQVQVRGSDYHWTIRYPGADRQLGTDDDVETRQDLHLPAGTLVHLELESDDYIYTFRLPLFGVNKMAVPELTFEAMFFSGAEGSSPLLGDQMCGFSHRDLIGEVVVHSQRGFSEWLRHTAVGDPLARRK